MLAYLRKRGYQWTEEQLRHIKASATATAQMQATHSSASQPATHHHHSSPTTPAFLPSSSSSSSSSSADDVLGEVVMELSLDVHSCLLHSLFTSHPRVTSPEHYDWSYAQLKSFIAGCVDLYASELRVVLWPLFLHSFLALFMRGCPSDALIFYAKHRKDHDAQHHAELTLLGQLHNESHIKQSEYTRLALTRKIDISVPHRAHTHTHTQAHSALTAIASPPRTSADVRLWCPAAVSCVAVWVCAAERDGV